MQIIPAFVKPILKRKTTPEELTHARQKLKEWAKLQLVKEGLTPEQAQKLLDKMNDEEKYQKARQYK